MDTIAELHEVEFLDSYAALPPTAPTNHARIVDVATFRPADGEYCSNIKLQDAVVTMLYKISPITLTAFLNAPTVPGSFRLVQKYTDGSSDDKLVIIKKGDYVTVGLFRERTGPESNVLEFDHLARLSIANGKWNLTYATYREYFRDDWDRVWSGMSVGVGVELDKATNLEADGSTRM
ncbi:Nn.00g087930.m01.CDS01 [Neocucurbitaria sp. VM-36]